MKSLEKATKIIKLFDRNFKHRWQRYNEKLLENIDASKVWIDCGCGDNDFVKEFGSQAKYAIGLDVVEPKNNEAPFVKSPVTSIPMKDGELDLATFRFVVEHLPNPEIDLLDLQRTLKVGGRVIIVTTNIINPIIALARIFPYSIKHRIITKTFKVDDDDVFPTFHKFNSPFAIKNGIGRLKPIYIEYISDINHINSVFFYIYLFVHLLTKPKVLNCYRSNILCVLEKV